MNEYFVVKQRLPRSPSHQGISAQPTAPSSAAPPPPSSSAGFALQTPSTNEISSVPIPTAAKPKSPPPPVSFIVIHNRKYLSFCIKGGSNNTTSSSYSS